MNEGVIIDTKKDKYCPKCQRTMRVHQNFYSSPRLDRYPEGYMNSCKKCFTMHIDMDDPATVMPLLEEMNLPYIPREWNNLVSKYRDNAKTTVTAIFGRYVAKMKLVQYRDYTYDDTESFFEEAKYKELNKQVNSMAEKQKYEEAKESGKIYENLENIDLNNLPMEELKELFQSSGGLFEEDEKDHNYEFDITPADKQYLWAKWGKTYRINDCIELEKFHNEMMDSYDIRTGSHKDYLLKISRVSLKMDQALEINDIEGFQKLSRVYDLLMKSAKFTASQVKDLSEDNLDAIGVAVGMCETEGFIPKFVDNERQDVVDFTIVDIKRYLDKLIKEEANLGNMVEIYLQKMVEAEAQEEGELDDDEDDILILQEKDEADILSDADFEDFNEMREQESEADLEALIEAGEDD